MLPLIRPYNPLPALLVMSLTLVGCVNWLSPPHLIAPRFSEQVTKPFIIGVTTREDVLAALKNPDLTRRNGLLWIYGWIQGSPYWLTEKILFIEFDQTGTLNDMELVESDQWSRKENFCLEDGVCLHTWEWKGAGLDEFSTVVTASDAEDAHAKQFVPNKDICGVYFTGNDIRISIGSIKDKMLDEDSYAFFELTPGKKVVLFSTYLFSTYDGFSKYPAYYTQKEFECRPGENVYLDVQIKWPLPFSRWPWEPAIPRWLVSLERHAQHTERIADRRLLLLDGPLANIRQDIDLHALVEQHHEVEEIYRQYVSRAPNDLTRLPYLCRAADAGHPNAQIEVGRHFAQGNYGIQKDVKHAYVWYSLADSGGSDMHLQLLLREMTSEQITEAKRMLADWKPGQCEHDLIPAASGN